MIHALMLAARYSAPELVITNFRALDYSDSGGSPFNSFTSVVSTFESKDSSSSEIKHSVSCVRQRSWTGEGHSSIKKPIFNVC